MNNDTIILFDLSGVLVELGGMPDFIKWTEKSAEDIGALWLMSESARDFERGSISFDEFHQLFTQEWEVDICAEDLFNAFESWVKQAFPGAIELLDELSGRYTLACLANTNSVQWPIVKKTIKADHYFERQFASHEIGKVKPDSEAYEHVIDALNTPAENIIFLDDNAMNVKAATEAGIRAAHVQGAVATREALVRFGVL